MRKSTSREHLLARHALVSEAPRPRPCAPFDQLALIGPARSSFLISTVMSVSMPLSDAAMDAVFRATDTTPAGPPINWRWMLAGCRRKTEPPVPTTARSHVSSDQVLRLNSCLMRAARRGTDLVAASPCILSSLNNSAALRFDSIAPSSSAIAGRSRIRGTRASCVTA